MKKIKVCILKIDPIMYTSIIISISVSDSSSVKDQTHLTDFLVLDEMQCGQSPTCLAILPGLALGFAVPQYQGTL
jgi:hypothetical protein